MSAVVVSHPGRKEETRVFLPEGWICLHRRIQQNSLWYRERFTPGQAWVDLLLSAAYKRHTVQLKRSSVVLVIERGQILTSQAKLAVLWRWDRKTIRAFLRGLERARMLLIQTTKAGPNGYTLLSVLNYDAYQGVTENPPLSDSTSGTHYDSPITPQLLPITNKENKENKELSKKKQQSVPVTQRGNSDAGSAPIGSHPRYAKEPSDLVWFEPDDSLGWVAEIDVELAKRFPERTSRLERSGETWQDDLRRLSNWHSTCAPSERKRLTAQRWLLHRLFPKDERKAKHANRHRPKGGGEVGGAKTFEQMQREDDARRLEEARERDRINREKGLVDAEGRRIRKER